MNFQKRDFVLIAGVLFVMVGLMPFMGPIFAVIIALAIYFGIKVFIGRKIQTIQKDAGEGFCAECGTKIIDKKCPNCQK